MRTYCVLLHIFAALLLCDYGMFSKPSPSPSEMSTTAVSATSDSHTTGMTTESVTTGNDTSSYTSDEEVSADFKDTTESSGEDHENYSKSLNESVRVVISSATHPSSTTHPLSTTLVKHHKEESIGKLTGGIIILVLILILIFCLLGILFFLRKKARSYSFDLTRVEGPGNDYDTPLKSDQQGLSYEQTNKDLPVSLNFIQEDKSEEKTNSIANGSAGEKTEQTPTSENDAPEENSLSSDSSSSTPVKKVEFNLDLDLLGSESEFSGPTEAEATDAAQNENNNNVTNAGRGPAEEIFTEISLDEPKEHA